MSDNDFLERLRDDARQLRYEPDAALWTRLPAKIRQRVALQTNASQLLARWFRPITASFLILALAAALSVAWLERGDSAYSVEAMGQNSMEITVGGDTFSIAE
jgi:hypothetical protein